MERRCCRGPASEWRPWRLRRRRGTGRARGSSGLRGGWMGMGRGKGSGKGMIEKRCSRFWWGRGIVLGGSEFPPFPLSSLCFYFLLSSHPSARDFLFPFIASSSSLTFDNNNKFPKITKNRYMEIQRLIMRVAWFLHSLAYAEMRLILTQLLLEFDFELCEESRDWNRGQRFYLLWERPPLYMRLRRSERAKV